MRGRPESLRYCQPWSNNPKDWVIRRKPLVFEWDPQRLYGSGLRCPRYSPASKPEFRAVREILMLDAKQRAAGSSPAGGKKNQKFFVAALAQLVRALVCGTRGRGFKTHMPPHPFTQSILTSFQRLLV